MIVFVIVVVVVIVDIVSMLVNQLVLHMIAAKLVPGLWSRIHPPGSDEEAASLHSTNSDCQFSHSQGTVILVEIRGIPTITT